MTHAEQVAQRHAEADERMTRSALQFALQASGGRQLYRWIEDASGVWDAPPLDERERAAWIGKRALGLFLLRSMREVDLDACLKAERERRDIEVARAAELDDARRLDEQERAAGRIFPTTTPNPQE